MVKHVQNERGFAIPLTIIIALFILALSVFAIDGGLRLSYRHQLQTVADAGSTAGINKASTYIKEDTLERVIEPEISVRNAFRLMYSNLSSKNIDTELTDGTIASDGTDNPRFIVVDMEARPLSDIEFETKIHGKTRALLLPLFGGNQYQDVYVISRTKLIQK